MVNREFIIAGIKNLMRRNYAVNPEYLDIEHQIDSTLTMYENWKLIKPKVFALCKK